MGRGAYAKVLLVGVTEVVDAFKAAKLGDLGDARARVFKQGGGALQPQSHQIFPRRHPKALLELLDKVGLFHMEQGGKILVF